MNLPHLIYRKEQTRTIIDTVQEALEIERKKENPNSLKTKQRDVVDKLIELGSQHKTISTLLKKFNLKLQD